MGSYLILFNENIFNFQNAITRECLRKLTLRGRLVMVENVERPGIEWINVDNNYPEIKSFAIVNAMDDDELGFLLRDCSGIDVSRVTTYRINN
jgi:hypothetical protein